MFKQRFEAIYGQDYDDARPEYDYPVCGCCYSRAIVTKIAAYFPCGCNKQPLDDRCGLCGRCSAHCCRVRKVPL